MFLHIPDFSGNNSDVSQNINTHYQDKEFNFSFYFS